MEYKIKCKNFDICGEVCIRIKPDTSAVCFKCKRQRRLKYQHERTQLKQSHKTIV